MFTETQTTSWAQQRRDKCQGRYVLTSAALNRRHYINTAYLGLTSQIHFSCVSTKSTHEYRIISAALYAQKSTVVHRDGQANPNNSAGSHSAQLSVRSINNNVVHTIAETKTMWQYYYLQKVVSTWQKLLQRCTIYNVNLLSDENSTASIESTPTRPRPFLC